VLMHKLCGGKVPKLHQDILDDEDKWIADEIQKSKIKIENLIEEYKFREALYEVIDLSRKGNQYMQKKQPWIVVKRTTDDGRPTMEAQKEIDNCLHLCLQLTANLAIFINPFLPNTAKKMLGMMKVVDKILDWENAGKLKLLSVGYSLRAPELLFRKIEDEEIKEQVEKLKSNSKNQIPNSKMEEAKCETANPKPAFDKSSAGKSEIVYDDFAKLDLRIGTITACEKVAKADKLLKLSVDLGTETRTIVSGIALHYTAEEMVGKQVVVVINLAPRKMKGIESQGMILTAEDKDGKLRLLKPEEAVNPGSTVS
jgi:methionyl-tRNA synthetase